MTDCTDFQPINDTELTYSEDLEVIRYDTMNIYTNCTTKAAQKIQEHREENPRKTIGDRIPSEQHFSANLYIDIKTSKKTLKIQYLCLIDTRIKILRFDLI